MTANRTYPGSIALDGLTADLKAGTIDQGLYGKLPPVNGTPVFPTVEQTTKAAQYLSDNWANAVS